LPSPRPPDDETTPHSLLPLPWHACLYLPPGAEATAAPPGTLTTIAEQFSPRYERHHDGLVSIDVSGLDRLLGPPRVIGEELRREAAARGIRAHVAIARTRMAAMVAALAHPGLTVIPHGEEAAALAPLPIALLEKIISSSDAAPSADSASSALAAFKHWGLKTLGEVAALPPADLVARLGRRALEWQAMARGDDVRPLVPTLAEERFESTIDLEWPIEELEPLSFVLTRLLEPLSTRLERRDRGAAVLHVLLRLVTRLPAPAPGSGSGGSAASGWERVVYARRLELPSPMRDVRTLRTLALLDLESHPPDAAIDRVTIVIDPTPGRVLQHTLFTRAHPTPEQLSTLLARLGALMGQDRFGAPATVDTYRPGAFVTAPFSTEHRDTVDRSERRARREFPVPSPQPPAPSPQPLHAALRRCRQPVPARVAVADGRPVRVTTDRRGFTGGSVVRAAGPWRTSGEWWAAERAGGAGRSGGLVGSGQAVAAGGVGETHPTHATHPTSWNRDEWDVSLSDGAMYRIFQDRETEAWFIDAIVD